MNPEQGLLGNPDPYPGFGYKSIREKMGIKKLRITKDPNPQYGRGSGYGSGTLTYCRKYMQNQHKNGRL
jgi:hypothetical protein